MSNESMHKSKFKGIEMSSEIPATDPHPTESLALPYRIKFSFYLFFVCFVKKYLHPKLHDANPSKGKGVRTRMF